MFERIDVLGMTDYTFTETAHAKSRGWDAAFGAGVVRVKEVSLVGARRLALTHRIRNYCLPSSERDRTASAVRWGFDDHPINTTRGWPDRPGPAAYERRRDLAQRRSPTMATTATAAITATWTDHGCSVSLAEWEEASMAMKRAIAMMTATR